MQGIFLLRLASQQPQCLADDLLRQHEIPATEHVHVSRTPPSEVLMSEIDHLNAGFLVMGTFGHSGWQKLLFGSTTRTMLDGCPLPMFLFH